MKKLMTPFLLIAPLMVLSPVAHALDAFEYQVYDGEVNKVGENSLETHLNSNFRGKTIPDYDGKLISDHLTHLTFEYARGLTPCWEIGSYFQTGKAQDGNLRYAGVKLRTKLVLPKKEEYPVHMGINFEVSNVPHEFEEDAWGSEIRPILGYSFSRFTMLFNPIIDMNLTAGKSATPDFSPALKLLFNTHENFGIGVEYYSDFGELNKLEPFSSAEQYAFAVFDLLHSAYELNIALGRGLTDAANPLIGKAIFGFTF